MRKCALVLCALIALNAPAVAAQPASEFDARLAAWSAAAKAGNAEDARKEAAALEDALEKVTPTPEQRERLYEAAASPYPASDNRLQDPGARLLSVLGPYLSSKDIAPIEKVFPRLNRHAKIAALELLSEKSTRSRAEAFVRLALSAAEDKQLDRLPLGALGEDAGFLNVLLPRLLKITDLDNQAAGEVYEMVLARLNDQTLPNALRAPVRDKAVAGLARLLPLIIAAEGIAKPEKPQREELADLIVTAGYILDILAHLPGEGVPAAIRGALAVKSAEVRLWAVVALLQHKQDVADGDIESIADALDTRYLLLRVLNDRGLAERFPQKYRSNEAIAIANMVQWLAHPFELGEPPQKIELTSRVEIEVSPGNKAEYFVYKFLPPASESDPDPKWQMGVSGPYTPGTFDIGGGDETFSDFIEWAPQKEEDEVKRIREKMEESRARREKE